LLVLEGLLFELSHENYSLYYKALNLKYGTVPGIAQKHSQVSLV